MANVGINWTAVPGATSYHVYRKAGAGAYTEIACSDPTVTTCLDNGLSVGTSYLYKVKAQKGAGLLSGYSNTDVATVVDFTDDLAPAAPPFTEPVVKIKATHVTELRQAIDAMRIAAGIGAGVYTPITAGTHPVPEHIRELRRQLNQARAALGLSPAVYTIDPAITDVTTVNRRHIDDLRNAIK